jgi:hypothetical protein
VPRNLNNKDIDQLLELANQPAEKKVKVKKTPAWHTEIDQFITECNIDNGKTRIPSYIVYYRYVLHKKIRLIPRLKFLRYFKTKFEKTRTVDGIGYLLSPKGFDLSPQFFFKARAFLRKEQDEAKKDQNSPK